MPAAMEGWRSSGGSSKDERELGVSTGSGEGQKGNEPAVFALGSKRQRRPSVRLGEIGDLAPSKSESFSLVRWISPNFVPRKVLSGGVKSSRTKPLANVAHRGEIGPQVAPSVATGDSVDREQEEAVVEAEEAPPSTSGRGSDDCTTTTKSRSGRRGKPGKRKRAASIRSSTIAKTIGAVALNRKAKELRKVGYIDNLVTAPAVADVSEVPIEFAELSVTHADMEEDSGGSGGDINHKYNKVSCDEEEHTQNGDTEVLEGDNGNGEDSSGRQDKIENQFENTNGSPGAPHDYQVLKGDYRDQCTSRLTDGEKGGKNALPLREASMDNGRSGDDAVRGWLGSLGLDKYSDLFEENEVDNDVLHLLTLEDLKEIGVVAVGARRKMFAAIQELGSAIMLSR